MEITDGYPNRWVEGENTRAWGQTTKKLISIPETRPPWMGPENGTGRPATAGPRLPIGDRPTGPSRRAIPKRPRKHTDTDRIQCRSQGSA